MFWKHRGRPTAGRESGEAARAAAPAPDTTLVAPVASIRTSLGADTVVSGKLSFNGPTRIEGTLRGEVRASDMLVVGEDAVVEGVVRVRKLIVLGHVRGEVRDAEWVEIGSSGRLTGTVEAQSLVVREGGYLNGDCRIAPPRAALRVVRPAAEKLVDSR